MRTPRTFLTHRWDTPQMDPPLPLGCPHPPTARILSTWSLALSILETIHTHTHVHTCSHTHCSFSFLGKQRVCWPYSLSHHRLKTVS